MIEAKMNLTFWESQLDEIWREQMEMIHPGKNLDEAIRESFGHLICDERRLQNADLSDFKRLVNGWLSNKRFPFKTNGRHLTEAQKKEILKRA